MNHQSTPMQQPGAPKTMRTFLIIWLGQLVSLLGSGLTGFALGVWIFTETGKATPFAMTIFFNVLPGLLLAPVAGSLVDRWNRRWVLIAADTGTALTSLLVFFLLSLGDLQIWHIYILAAVSSSLGAFQRPAYMASVTLLVPKAQFARASGMTQMGEAASQILSPLLAGLLFGLIGLRGIILVDFVTFLFAIGALLFVQIPNPPQTETPGQGKRSVFGDALFGWNYLKSRSGLFGLLWFYALVNFFLNGSMVMLGPLVLSFSEPAGLGFVQTLAGVGMLAGSVVMSIWGGPQKRVYAIFGFIALGAVGIFVMGLNASLAFPAVGLALLMFAIPLASGPSQAIFQAKVAPGVQGRVFAIRGMISGSMLPLATLVSGPLADRVFEPLMQPGAVLAASWVGSVVGIGAGRGVALMFISAGVLLFFATIIAYSIPTIRLVESSLPDVLPDEVEAQPEPQPAAATPAEANA